MWGPETIYVKDSGTDCESKQKLLKTLKQGSDMIRNV